VRADLREEFDMADEAFALSPISARATLPSEEDYAAIAEAFMETSRGRWFLTEYAKRNRNTDTRMVLDAVARIEQSLAAQREEDLAREASLQREDGLSAQQAAEAVAAAAAAQDRLTEALAAIRSSVEAAEELAVEALDSLALEQRLAPVRKGARVLREIAWRLREIAPTSSLPKRRERRCARPLPPCRAGLWNSATTTAHRLPRPKQRQRPPRPRR
jgi:hypothetical protein